VADNDLTDPQRRYVAELAGQLRDRSIEVRNWIGRSPRPLAESRPWANFRPALKELLFPVVIERAAGSQVWDRSGNQYTDYCMGFGVHLFGHSPEFVTRAIERQLRRNYSIGSQFAPTYELAEQFCRITGHDRVTFCCTGTEAVLGAVRLARLATGRNKIVYFHKSYHGLADGVLATVGSAGGPAVPAAAGLSPGAVGEAIVLRYGDDAALRTLDAVRDQVAAVIVEPIQNRNPTVQPAEFLRSLRGLTARAGIVLILDEMITGFRLGLRGAQGRFGIKPDLATYGKVLGGGLPIGAIAGVAALMDGMDGGSWTYADDSAPTAATTLFGGTFQKHPLAIAAARAVLDHLEYRGEELYLDLDRQARAAVTGLAEIFGRAGLPYAVSSYGSVWRFEYTGPPDPAQALLFDMMYHSFVATGIYAWKGRSFFLSTEHSGTDIARLLDSTEQVIERLRAAQFLPERARDRAGIGAGGGGS